MPIHQIKVGNYIRELHTRKLNEDLTEDYYMYYLVLDVSENTVDVVPYAGSSSHTKTVFEIEEIKKEYSVSIITDVQIQTIYSPYTRRYGNLNCQKITGHQYSWNGKTVVISMSNIYYAGNGVWREIPEGF